MLSDSIRVNQKHEGDIIPGTQQDFLRKVFIGDNGYVFGAVFGAEIDLTGTCIAEKSVFATGDVKVKNTKPVIVHGSLGAIHNIATEGGNPGYLKVGGDIFAERVSLTNAFVVGSVSADEVHLCNSVVLGPVVAKRKAFIERSMVYFVKANLIKFGDNVKLMLPVAIAKQNIQMKSPVKLAFLEQQSGILTETDCVIRGDKVICSGGLRITDLSSTRERIKAMLETELAIGISDELMEGNTTIKPQIALAPKEMTAMMELRD